MNKFPKFPTISFLLVLKTDKGKEIGISYSETIDIDEVVPRLQKLIESFKKTI